MKVLSQKNHITENSQIVADGRWRIRVDGALIEKVRAEIESEYRQEINKAKTTWQRWLRHWKIERELSRRLKERYTGSDEALYLRK